MPVTSGAAVRIVSKDIAEETCHKRCEIQQQHKGSK